ncbi:transposase [Tahibacter harae]|uniref:Transposase n=1 Tax=Tahibacter harae TaxID=2963937 RepID=A0ABT1QRM3_9GAMM|nr:transposase [Tahibacter harae]MCQ4164929.1 transposase [Tahibacter harae]
MLLAMTVARSHLVAPDAEGCYHCIQRCVRRAFLCGEDRYTGRSYEHRKVWVEDRLRLLGECFAVAIHAFAIMSNHLHLVVQINPALASSWSDAEVAARWLRLFPAAGDDDVKLRCEQLVANPERLAVIRRRLSNLSWFMRCLAEPIARRANREDDCKGRFWEGRFKCQVLCDERAVLAAMAYVDLNPIRAGTVERLDESTHTSVHKRISTGGNSPETLTEPMRPVMGTPLPKLSLSAGEYLQILDWTGRVLAPGKPGKITAGAPVALARIEESSSRWTLRVRGYGDGWYRAVGSAHDLAAWAEKLGQRWLKGIRLALRLAL